MSPTVVGDIAVAAAAVHHPPTAGLYVAVEASLVVMFFVLLCSFQFAFVVAVDMPKLMADIGQIEGLLALDIHHWSEVAQQIPDLDMQCPVEVACHVEDIRQMVAAGMAAVHS